MAHQFHVDIFDPLGRVVEDSMKVETEKNDWQAIAAEVVAQKPEYADRRMRGWRIN